MKNPVEWRGLPCDRQIHPLVILYMSKFTIEKPFSSGKLSPSYFKLRAFFNSLYDRESTPFMNMIYEFLWYTEPELLTVSEVIKFAKQRKQILIDEKIKEILGKKNEKVTVKDVLG